MTRISATFTVPNGMVHGLYNAYCPIGKRVISGGYGGVGLLIDGSFPVDSATDCWQVWANNAGASKTLKVYAICM